MNESLESIRLTPAERALAGDAADAILAARRLLMAAQRLRYLMDQRFRADGLTTQQAALLTVARDLEGPTLAQAAKMMGSSHQNVKQLVTALERKGLLRYDIDPQDGRVRRLSPTARSDALWSSRDVGDFAAVAGWFGSLSPAEVSQLAGLLDQLETGLRHVSPTDGPPSAGS
ncbi:MAG: MarR family transcriptional regulator [Caulobacter sp.]|nr:MarR family transcriptional regulator [Caulobacter sp.]